METLSVTCPYCNFTDYINLGSSFCFNCNKDMNEAYNGDFDDDEDTSPGYGWD